MTKMNSTVPIGLAASKSDTADDHSDHPLPPGGTIEPVQSGEGVVVQTMSAAVVTAVSPVRAQAEAARTAWRPLARAGDPQRSAVLLHVAHLLGERQEVLLAANAEDVARTRAGGATAAALDRLQLSPQRLAALAADVRRVAALPDPLGELGPMRTLPNGLLVGQRRVPLGVIAIIYEGRPNVTVDAATLCIKAGNAVVLRGSSSAIVSNRALTAVLREALSAAGLPGDAVQLVDSTSRERVGELLRLRGLIDVAIPRGGADLIRYVAEQATVPVIETGAGVCHTYVDGSADPEMAVEIVCNAKVRRPSICNALDTLLVDQANAERLLPRLAGALQAAGVRLHCDAAALTMLQNAGLETGVQPAEPGDWGHEFLSLDAAVGLVDGLDGALEHIARFGSGHSEAIVTARHDHAMRFLNEVDAAAVYVNASTQFTDGGQFGLGAEIGISTQKLHARGPMGLREITTYKWVILGDGQVRPA
jgi:glutamate-5-semialdehyde dehydrogenase